jgi:hypothetical protein
MLKVTYGIGEAVSKLLYRHGGPLEVALVIDDEAGPLAIHVRDLMDGSRIIVSSDGVARVVDLKAL